MRNIEIEKRERLLRDAAAAEYEGFIRRTKGQLWDKMEKEVVLQTIDPDSNDIILDAGCGVGRHSLVLAEKAKKVISMDFSGESLKILKRKMERKNITNIEILSCNMTNCINLADCSVHKILCSQVLQHIPYTDERQDILRNFYRILKPGGFLVIIVYRWGGSVKSEKEGFFDNGLYRYAFTREECADLISRAGFSHVRVMGMLNIPKLRLISKLFWELAIYTELFLEKLPVSNTLGQFLIAEGQKTSV